MSRLEFEPTIPVFDRVAAVIRPLRIYILNIVHIGKTIPVQAVVALRVVRG
jgi:hypothetical protein